MFDVSYFISVKETKQITSAITDHYSKSSYQHFSDLELSVFLHLSL